MDVTHVQTFLVYWVKWTRQASKNELRKTHPQEDQGDWIIHNPSFPRIWHGLIKVGKDEKYRWPRNIYTCLLGIDITHIFQLFCFPVSASDFSTSLRLPLCERYHAISDVCSSMQQKLIKYYCASPYNSGPGSTIEFGTFNWKIKFCLNNSYLSICTRFLKSNKRAKSHR